MSKSRTVPKSEARAAENRLRSQGIRTGDDAVRFLSSKQNQDDQVRNDIFAALGRQERVASALRNQRFVRR